MKVFSVMHTECSSVQIHQSLYKISLYFLNCQWVTSLGCIALQNYRQFQNVAPSLRKIAFNGGLPAVVDVVRLLAECDVLVRWLVMSTNYYITLCTISTRISRAQQLPHSRLGTKSRLIKVI